ncbi:MAG: FAD-dependent oxidoreductase [Anaerolineales bacterium]|nr:FAD-dependent oxidoreductase [Anaerolineales bacterium]
MTDLEHEEKKISRREFFKNAAGAAAVAGAAVLTGCADQTPEAVPEPAPTCAPCPTPEPAKTVECGTYSFETPPDPIPDSDIKETVTTDILVIGAGTSGLPAAIRAKEAGAEVIVIDKFVTSRYGGGDNSIINSRLQKKLGIEVDPDEVCLALQKYANNWTNQALIRLWADHSGEYMDWLMDMTEAQGLEWSIAQWPRPAHFDNSTEYYEEFPTCHNIAGGTLINGVGAQGTILKVEREKFAELGGEIRFETRAKQLIKENGRVTGAIAQDKDGNYIKFVTNKAVILATGCYAGNREMMQKYCASSYDLFFNGFNLYETQQPELMEAKQAGAEPNNYGDGHMMCLWIGGQMQVSPHAPVSHALTRPFGPCAFLAVNTLGERFHNEDVTSQGISNQLYFQPGNISYHIFDSKWPEQIPYMGVGLMKTIGEVSEEQIASINENTMHADTIEELAALVELPADALKATIERYNELCEKGHDDDYGKRMDRMYPISTPPYFVGQSFRMALVVLGGLRTNNKLQLLDGDMNVIPGIYLVGNTVGDRFALDYPTMCPGLTHGMAGTHGYLVGSWAASA